MSLNNPIQVLQRENTRLKEENDRLRQEVSSLREFVEIINTLKARTIKSDSELLPLLNEILVKALKLLNAPDGSLLLLDDETNELVFVIVHGAKARDLLDYHIPADQGIAGWVVRHAKPTLVRDVRTDIRFSHTVDEQFKFTTQSIAAAPLIGEGKVYGVVEALNKPGDQPFSENDVALLELVCHFAGERLAVIDRQKPVK